MVKSDKLDKSEKEIKTLNMNVLWFSWFIMWLSIPSVLIGIWLSSIFMIVGSFVCLHELVLKWVLDD